MARARLTPSGWNATLPLIRADSWAAELVAGTWAIWTPSTGDDRALFVGTRAEVTGTLSEGGRVGEDGDRLVITDPFDQPNRWSTDPADDPVPTVGPRCVECGRRFDLTDPTDADEWSYGHDCEA